MEFQNFQVLIVDDNEPNRDMLARRLRRNDFELSTAVNGREALSMIQTNLYDLILLDIMMPEVDGYMVLKHLKSEPRLRNIPVIMISALEEMDSVMKCMEIGADDYLTKPFDPDLLKAAVSRCLANKVQSPTPPKIPFERVPKATTAFKGQNQDTAFNLPDETTRGTSTNLLDIDEVAHRIMQKGAISRKGYLYFSKAIYNSLFENVGLSDQDLYQIRSVFEAIHSGKVKVVDSTSSK